MHVKNDVPLVGQVLESWSDILNIYIWHTSQKEVMCYDTPLRRVEISGLISPGGGAGNRPWSMFRNRHTVSEQLNHNVLECIYGILSLFALVLYVTW